MKGQSCRETRRGGGVGPLHFGGGGWLCSGRSVTYVLKFRSVCKFRTARFRNSIISLRNPVDKILKIIVNFLLPKSLWFAVHLSEADGTRIKLPLHQSLQTETQQNVMFAKSVTDLAAVNC